MSTACVVLLFIFFSLPSLSLQASSPNGPKFNGGLVIELIHQDSSESPLRNPDAKRSITDYKSIRSNLKSSSLPQDLTEPVVYGYPYPLYFMRLSIGTPPVEVMLLMDTGSDLIWTQCRPCKYCYAQDGPIFDPSSSSTYAVHECDSEECDQEHSRRTKLCTPDGECIYSRAYGSESQYSGRSLGILSSETFTMNSSNGLPVTFPDILFGCGLVNSVNFTKLYAGIVGLSGDDSSLISQLGMQMGSWRFSYCLTPPWSEKKGNSHLYVGANAVFLGNSTPMAIEPSGRNVRFYYLKLEDISVGSKRLRIPPGMFDKTADNAGGVIIDSGTPLTYLKKEAFDMLVQEFEVTIVLPPAEPSEPELKDWLCFLGSREDLVEEYIPILTFHFSGLDVPLHPSISFIEIADMVCFTIHATNGLNIIGHLAQQNMNVGYDLDNDMLTMAPIDCSNY